MRHIQACYARPQELGQPDEEMQRLTREDLLRRGLPLPDPAGPYDHVLRPLSSRVARTIRAQRGVDITQSSAVGALHDPSVNAGCYRSDESHYAIVIHHGLMNMLHKHAKLLTAAVNPGWVVYCNRVPPTLLTSDMLAAWAAELGEIYLTTGETKGAIVKLNPTGSAIATTTLTLAESFVLGHEVGHYLAGHLEERSHLVQDAPFPRLALYAENTHHLHEFEADDYGYQAMVNHLQPAPAKTVLLGAIVSTFEVLRMVGAGEVSPSHPAAVDRIHRVVADHFDAETVKLVHRWIDDGDRAAAAQALTSAR